MNGKSEVGSRKSEVTRSAGATKPCPTPTLDKIASVRAESQAIGNFLDWLAENKMWVGQYLKIDGLRDAQGSPVRDNTEQLLARYFEIDLNKAEKEREALLATLR